MADITPEEEKFVEEFAGTVDDLIGTFEAGITGIELKKVLQIALRRMADNLEDVEFVEDAHKKLVAIMRLADFADAIDDLDSSVSVLFTISDDDEDNDQ